MKPRKSITFNKARCSGAVSISERWASINQISSGVTENPRIFNQMDHPIVPSGFTVAAVIQPKLNRPTRCTRFHSNHLPNSSPSLFVTIAVPMLSLHFHSSAIGCARSGSGLCCCHWWRNRRVIAQKVMELGVARLATPTTAGRSMVWVHMFFAVLGWYSLPSNRTLWQHSNQSDPEHKTRDVDHIRVGQGFTSSWRTLLNPQLGAAIQPKLSQLTRYADDHAVHFPSNGSYLATHHACRSRRVQA